MDKPTNLNATPRTNHSRKCKGPPKTPNNVTFPFVSPISKKTPRKKTESAPHPDILSRHENCLGSYFSKRVPETGMTGIHQQCSLCRGFVLDVDGICATTVLPGLLERNIQRNFRSKCHNYVTMGLLRQMMKEGLFISWSMELIHAT